MRRRRIAARPGRLAAWVALAGLLLAVGAAAAPPAFADPPAGKHGQAGKPGGDKPGGDKRGGGKHGKDTRGDDGPGEVRGGGAALFAPAQRDAIRVYYDDELGRGRCPPGLAKKNNGCLPPGLAKRYEIGRPLPREVIFYEVPRPILERLGPPPRGYRYVRVSNDILMLARGTGIVADALVNLGAAN